MNLFARMSRWSPVLPLIGGGRNLLQPVAVEVVARCFAGALTRQESIGRTLDVCGSRRLTGEQPLDAILRGCGRRRIKLPLPFWLARFQAALLQGFVGGLLGKAPPLTLDQVRMLEEHNVGDPSLMEELFSITQTPFEEGVRAQLR